MKDPFTLKAEACQEGYEYFDVNIRSLPRAVDGTFDESDSIFVNSDIDAFRHAYVSAIFTHEYGASVADLFGRLNELTFIFSVGASPGEKNMDLWNNAVGRRYGKEFKNKSELQQALRKALENGELIVAPEDTRMYQGAGHFELDQNKPIVVLDESKTGRNEVFYDFVGKKVFTRPELVSAIKSGEYTGYSIRIINGQEVPVSKSDGNQLNNLG